MKNTIKAIAAIIVLTNLVSIAGAQIRENAGIENQQLAVALTASIPSSGEENRFSAHSAEALNMRALTGFQKMFSGTQNAAWEKTPEGGFVATFSTEDKKALVAFDSKGHWMHTIYFYGAEKLPEDIKENVLDMYGDFKITQVDEVNLPDAEDVYLIHLENTATARIVRICGDNTEEIETLYKQ